MDMTLMDANLNTCDATFLTTTGEEDGKGAEGGRSESFLSTGGENDCESELLIINY
jgi:hypothetical protein